MSDKKKAIEAELKIKDIEVNVKKRKWGTPKDTKVMSVEIDKILYNMIMNNVKAIGVLQKRDIYFRSSLIFMFVIQVIAYVFFFAMYLAG